MATITFDGIWTKYNNVAESASDTTGTDGRIPIGTAGKGDESHTLSATVIRDGGIYKMWYVGNGGGKYRIYYATSLNGLTWTKYNNAIPSNSDTTGTDGRIPLGTSGKADELSADEPCVIKDGSTYKMWYNCSSTSHQQISYATSPDGLTWTKVNNAIESASNTTGTDGRIPLGTAGKGDDNRTVSPTVILKDGTYHMWYSGNDGSEYRIYYASSSDGLTWTKKNNVAEADSDTTGTDGRIPQGTGGKGDDKHVFSPTVIHNGTEFIMLYSGSDGSKFRIYSATSPDGLTWTKTNNVTPTTSDTTSSDGRIPMGTSGKGDDNYVFRPAVLLDGTTYKVWYSGNDGAAINVYYATSKGVVAGGSSSDMFLLI